METALRGHRKWAMTDAGNKCRWEKRKTSPLSVGTFRGWRKAFQAVPLCFRQPCSPFPVQAVPQGESSPQSPQPNPLLPGSEDNLSVLAVCSFYIPLPPPPA